jgi:hypothetical protein
VESELLLILQHISDAMEIIENVEEENHLALVHTVGSIIKSFQRLHGLEPTITESVPFEFIE